MLHTSLASLSVHMRPFPHSLLATDFSSLSLCFAATAQHSLARSPARNGRDRPTATTNRSLAPSIVVVLPRSTDQAGRQAGNHLTCPPRLAAFMVPPLRRRRGRARLPVERRRPGEEEWGASGGGHMGMGRAVAHLIERQRWAERAVGPSLGPSVGKPSSNWTIPSIGLGYGMAAMKTDAVS